MKAPAQARHEFCFATRFHPPRPLRRHPWRDVGALPETSSGGLLSTPLPATMTTTNAGDAVARERRGRNSAAWKPCPARIACRMPALRSRNRSLHFIPPRRPFTPGISPSPPPAQQQPAENSHQAFPEVTIRPALRPYAASGETPLPPRRPGNSGAKTLRSRGARGAVRAPAFARPATRHDARAVRQIPWHSTRTGRREGSAGEMTSSATTLAHATHRPPRSTVRRAPDVTICPSPRRQPPSPPRLTHSRCASAPLLARPSLPANPENKKGRPAGALL